jgi:hypothetical protein
MGDVSRPPRGQAGLMVTGIQNVPEPLARAEAV